jgi:hypothetical protein
MGVASVVPLERSDSFMVEQIHAEDEQDHPPDIEDPGQQTAQVAGRHV